MKYQLFLILLILPMVIIPVFADHPPELQIIIEDGKQYPGIGKYINIMVTGAYQTSEFKIIDSNENVVESMSFVASDQGDFNLPWIIPKSLDYGIYTIIVTDQNNNSVQTIFEYKENFNQLSFSISTDKDEYFFNDTINISGNVGEVFDDLEITVYFISNNRILANIVGIHVLGDGNFTSSIIAKDGNWIYSNEYVIKAYYKDKIAETSINYVGAEPIITSLSTDKSKYYSHEMIHVTGITEKFIENVNLSISVSLNNTNSGIFTEYPNVNVDDTFDFDFKPSDYFLIENETYKIITTYGSSYMETTFELLSYNIQITSDKSTYYKSENIIITGIMDNLNEAQSKTIIYELFYNDTSILTDNSNIINDNGTINIVAPTMNDTILNNGESYDIMVTIQGQSSNLVSFTYYDTVNMEPEYLYSIIIDNMNIINRLEALVSELSDKIDNLLLNDTTNSMVSPPSFIPPDT